jgi:hypothetical protein
VLKGSEGEVGVYDDGNEGVEEGGDDVGEGD